MGYRQNLEKKGLPAPGFGLPETFFTTGVTEYHRGEPLTVGVILNGAVFQAE